jgi:HB1, ASXL, restriction endonuclease HTH domain
MDYATAAEEALRENGKPMHSTEIAEYARKRGWISPDGKTPDHSIQAAVWKTNKKLGNKSPFVVIGKAKVHRKYALRSTAK